MEEINHVLEKLKEDFPSVSFSFCKLDHPERDLWQIYFSLPEDKIEESVIFDFAIKIEEIDRYTAIKNAVDRTIAEKLATEDC